jgi:uncharacterized membrane protein YgcG
VALASSVAVVAFAAVLASSLLDADKARSTAIRGQLAAGAMSMALERPLVGVGLGRFVAHFPSHGGVVPGPHGVPFRVDSPHNEALQMFAEGGLPALASLAWVAVVALRLLLKLVRSPNAAARTRGLALGLCLLGLSLDALLGFPLRLGLPPLLWAIVLGLLSLPEPGERAEPSQWHAGPAGGSAAFARVAALVAVGSLGGSLPRLAGDRALYRLRKAEAERRFGDAAAEGRSAVRADPRPASLLALARAELRLGRPAAAASLLGRTLEVWPQDATAIGTLGLARLALGDPGAGPALRLARALGVGLFQDGPEPRPGPAAGGDSCSAGISFELLASGRVNLSARMQPITAVLSCLGGRTGLHVEYDGPPPRQAVTLNLSDASLATAVETLFEGLGLDFALSSDAGGTTLSRLIVFAASGAARRPASSSPVAAPSPVSEAEPEEPEWFAPAEEPAPDAPPPPPELFPGAPQPGLYGPRGPTGSPGGVGGGLGGESGGESGGSSGGGGSGLPSAPELPESPSLTPSGG